MVAKAVIKTAAKVGSGVKNTAAKAVPKGSNKKVSVLGLPPIKQSTVIAGAIFLAFILYITITGRLGDYIMALRGVTPETEGSDGILGAVDDIADDLGVGDIIDVPSLEEMTKGSGGIGVKGNVLEEIGVYDDLQTLGRNNQTISDMQKELDQLRKEVESLPNNFMSNLQY